MLIRLARSSSVRCLARPVLARFSSCRDGDSYHISDQQIEEFHTKGYTILKGFLNKSEVAELSNIYDKFMAGEVDVKDKDFCDMAGGFDRITGGNGSNANTMASTIPKLSVVNFMLPRVYYPPLAGNIYERVSATVAKQIFPGVEGGMVLDYDQLLNKNPSKGDAVFAWHQDLAYWPLTNDTRTCTFSLAIDSTDTENGCMRFVPGSHLEPNLRPHRPLSEILKKKKNEKKKQNEQQAPQTQARTQLNSNDSDGGTGTNGREEAHALVAEVEEEGPGAEPIEYAVLEAGDVSIHNERVVHGSGGNISPSRQRRTYVIAYRTKETVEWERRHGFTHSHNDVVNWDTFNKW